MIPNKGKTNSSGRKTENLTKVIEWSGIFSLLGKSTLLLIWISSAVSYRFRIHLKQPRTYCLLILYFLFSLFSLSLLTLLTSWIKITVIFFYSTRKKKEVKKKLLLRKEQIIIIQFVFLQSFTLIREILSSKYK